MKTTPEQLLRELDRLGCPVTLRVLTDWRQKGLLPRLSRRGRGQGRGAEWYWTHGDIVDRATTIYEIFEVKWRADFALKALWFSGFDVDLKLIRRVWTKTLKHTLKVTFGITDIEQHRQPSNSRMNYQAEELEERYAKQARSLARGLSKAKSVNIDDAEHVVSIIMGLFVIPEFKEDVDLSAVEAVLRVLFKSDDIGKFLHRFAEQEKLKSLISEIQSHVFLVSSIDFINSVSDQEFIEAHTLWKSFMTSVDAFAESYHRIDNPVVGLTNRKKLFSQIGPLIIFGILRLGQTKYKAKVITSISLINSFVIVVASAMSYDKDGEVILKPDFMPYSASDNPIEQFFEIWVE